MVGHIFTLPFPSSLLSSSLHIFFLYNLFYTGADCFELVASENLKSTKPNPYIQFVQYEIRLLIKRIR